MARSRFTAGMTLVGLGLATSGCSAFYGQTSTAGARPFPMHYETVDLVQLLDPEGKAAKANAKEWKTLDQGQQIDLAFYQYHERMRIASDADAEVASRDEIQERILGASNQLCHQYQQYMQNVNSSSNFALGFLTTATAAAAAVVTGGTSQILAGTAAAAAGTRAEFNQDFFYAETVSTIFRGIDAARERAYKAIILRRRQAPLPAGTTETLPLPKYTAKESIATYPIEAAVKDAIQYHARCSLVTGVEELGDSVQLAKNPGLDAVQETLFKVNAARQTVLTNATSQGDLAFASPVGSGAGGSEDSAAARNPVAAYASLIDSIDSSLKEFSNRIQRLTLWPAESAAKVATAAKDRADAAKAQIQDETCKKSVADASKSIVDAQINLANAVGDADKAAKASALKTANIEAQAKINALNLAVETYTADIRRLRDAVEAANREATLKGGDAKIDMTKIDPEITNIAKAPPVLACKAS